MKTNTTLKQNETTADVVIKIPSLSVPIDKTFNATLGGRLRQLRKMHNLSQEKVGEIIGCSFQQIQKYENGQNCIGIQKLLKLMAAINIRWEELFEPGSTNPDVETPTDVMELIKAFTRLPDAQRASLLNVVTSMRGKCNAC